jgi:hypothetical protein
MHGPAAELADRLARNAEAVCRHYLSNGRREGRYWLVGDINNNPGRSLYVRLRGVETGSGAAGKWTDAATGDHGDLLDLIAACRNLQSLRDTLDEARLFLSLPRTESHANRVARSGASPICDVEADHGHSRTIVFAPTRHYGCAAWRPPALSSSLLVSR